MKIDRLSAFMGKPIKFNDVFIHPPTIDEIAEIGEIAYNVHVALATFEKETILKQMFRVSDDDYDLISNEDAFDILTSESSVIDLTTQAISFFVKDEVKFDNKSLSYFINNIRFIDKSNYVDFSEIIKDLNCISKKDEPKFKNDRVRKKYMQMLAEKNKFNKGKNDSLELKDILSILCSAEGNGINILNCGQLKIYQVYEQFERVNVKENHMRTLQLWANTFTLKEDAKLPEWIIKTKL